MEAEPGELAELLRTANKRNQVQCYTAIHTTIGWVVFFSMVALIAALVINIWRTAAFFLAFVVLGFLSILMLGLTDLLATTVWWIVLAAGFGFNLALVMHDAQHFFGKCTKPYCFGWMWPAFEVYFVFAVLNLVPVVVMMYFMWKIWVLEVEDNRLAKPKRIYKKN